MTMTTTSELLLGYVELGGGCADVTRCVRDQWSINLRLRAARRMAIGAHSLERATDSARSGRFVR